MVEDQKPFPYFNIFFLWGGGGGGGEIDLDPRMKDGIGFVRNMIN